MPRCSHVTKTGNRCATTSIFYEDDTIRLCKAHSKLALYRDLNIDLDAEPASKPQKREKSPGRSSSEEPRSASDVMKSSMNKMREQQERIYKEKEKASSKAVKAKKEIKPEDMKEEDFKIPVLDDYEQPKLVFEALASIIDGSFFEEEEESIQPIVVQKKPKVVEQEEDSVEEDESEDEGPSRPLVKSESKRGDIDPHPKTRDKASLAISRVLFIYGIAALETWDPEKLGGITTELSADPDITECLYECSNDLFGDFIPEDPFSRLFCLLAANIAPRYLPLPMGLTHGDIRKTMRKIDETNDFKVKAPADKPKPEPEPRVVIQEQIRYVPMNLSQMTEDEKHALRLQLNPVVVEEPVPSNEPEPDILLDVAEPRPDCVEEENKENEFNLLDE